MLFRSGFYRVDMLSRPVIAWQLDAETTATADDGKDTPKPWSFWFVDGELVAVGAMVPHWNRSSWSDLWTVRELSGRTPSTDGAAPRCRRDA